MAGAAGSALSHSPGGQESKASVYAGVWIFPRGSSPGVLDAIFSLTPL